MDTKEKDQIYDRLLEIRLDLEADPQPDLQYINTKLGQCHIFIEEVEKLSIRVNREMSIFQRALNTSEADYESSKENLIANDENIRNLPSIRDREAKANSNLVEKLSEIRTYKGELADLNNLSRAINLKLKNLNRINGDIKLQLRLIESQLRMGVPAKGNESVRNLMAALRDTPSIEADDTSIEESAGVDPTSDLDIDQLLNNQEKDQDLIDPDSSEAGDEKRFEDPDLLEDSEYSTDDSESKETESQEEDAQKIDLNELIDVPIKKEDTQKEEPTENVEQKEKKGATQKAPANDEIDIDALLNNFN